MVSEATSDNALHSVKDVNLAVPLIEPEGAFVHVPLEMLLRELVIGSVEHPLQNRPHALNAVG